MGTKHLVLSQKAYTSSEVVTMVGCSYRQLDYWCRVGLVPGHTEPVGSGRRRSFTDENVRRARMVMLASRLSNQSLETTVAMLEHEFTLRELDREVRSLEAAG